MRIRFFVPTQQETPIVAAPAKHVNEESMEESSQQTSSEAENSTAGEDSSLSLDSISLLELEDGIELPEMDERQADRLKRLLLSPLEPDSDF